jgi:hypothetical protein
MKSCDCFMCNGFFIDDDECDCEVNQDAAPPVFNRHVCKPKEYIGLMDKFFYCEECGNKLEDK